VVSTETVVPVVVVSASAVVVGSGMDEVVVGSGMDEVVVGSGMDEVVVGSGMDEVVVGSGIDDVLVGSGIDEVVVGRVGGGSVVVVVGRGGRVVPGLDGLAVVGDVVPESGLFGAAVGGGWLVTGGSGLMRMDVVPWATTPARTAALTGAPVVGTPVVELVVVLAGAVTENVKGAKTGATSVRTSSSECEPGMVVEPAVSSVLTLTPSLGLFGRASPTTPAPNRAAAAPKAHSTRLRLPGSPSSSVVRAAGSESGGSKTGGWREPPDGRRLLPPPSSFPGIPVSPTIVSLPLVAQPTPWTDAGQRQPVASAMVARDRPMRTVLGRDLPADHEGRTSISIGVTEVSCSGGARDRAPWGRPHRA
jgi:hypothetical protein